MNYNDYPLPVDGNAIMKQKETRVFNRKLMAMISVIIFLLVAVLAVANYSLSIRNARRMARKYLTAITEGVAETVDSWLLEKCNTVRLMATSPTLLNFIDKDFSAATPRLRQIYDSMPGYENVFLADRNGIIRSDTHKLPAVVPVDLKTRPYWKNFAAGGYQQLFSPKIERSPVTGRLVAVIIQSVRDSDGRIKGFFGTSLDWDHFLEKFLLPVKVGATGYVAITDLEGRNIGHPDKSLNLKDLSENQWMRRIITEKTGFQRYRFRNEAKFMAYRQSWQTGWIVNASINESELIQGAVYTRNLFMVIGAILLIVLLLVVGYLDVFRLSRAQEELRRSQILFQLIFNRGSDGIFVHDVDMKGNPGDFSQVNRKFLSLVNLPRGQVVGKSAARIIADRVHDDYSSMLRDVLRDKYRMVETKIETREGNRLHVELRMFLIESPGVRSVMCFVRDITMRIESRRALRRSRDELDVKVRERTRELEIANRKLQQQFSETEKMAAALSESEAKYRSLVERANDGILLVEEGRVVFANHRIVEMMGMECEELIGMDFAGCVVPEEIPAIRESYNRRIGGSQRNAIFETRFRASSGRILDVELNAGIIDYDGRPVDFIFVRDVSERKRAEEADRRYREQLIQTDKLAALGTLVSGVAHEINNPNNAIMLNASVLAEVWEEARPIFEDYRERCGDFNLAGMPYSQMRERLQGVLEDMEDGSRRIKNIVDDLKDFARPATAQMSDGLFVNDVVRSSIKLISNQILKSTDHFHIEYGDNLPSVRGNFQRLEQVVVNLLQNACHALPDRERGIRIRTHFHRPTGNVVIEVADEGEGIPEEEMKQIMNPFFTTKRDRGGTGLGLSVSLSLVKEHGGDLRFESEPGRGTRAMVLIPASLNPDDLEDENRE